MVPFRGTRDGGSLIPSRVSGAPLSRRACQRENNKIPHVVNEPSALMSQLCVNLNFIKIAEMLERCFSVAF